MLDVLRREIKYNLTYAHSVELESKLKCMLKMDVNSDDIGYSVRSLYFDSFNNQDYWDKKNGLEYRKKIRLRIYNNSDCIIKLELKEKQGIFQRKRSLSLTRSEADDLIKLNYDVLLGKGEFAKYMYSIMKDNGYRPVCVVQYNRKAYIHPVGDTRITFDSDIRTTECNFDIFDHDLMLYPVEVTTNIILEVKYNEFIISPLKELIASVDQTSRTYSKYCKGRQISLGGN